MQLGVEQKVNQRRASLVSQLYSEGPVIGKGGGDAAGNKSQQQQSGTTNLLGASGGGSSGNNIVIPKVRPPPPGVMRRQVPQGKFGLLGMGKSSIVFKENSNVFRHLGPRNVSQALSKSSR